MRGGCIAGWCTLDGMHEMLCSTAGNTFPSATRGAHPRITLVARLPLLTL